MNFALKGWFCAKPLYPWQTLPYPWQLLYVSIPLPPVRTGTRGSKQNNNNNNGTATTTTMTTTTMTRMTMTHDRLGSTTETRAGRPMEPPRWWGEWPGFRARQGLPLGVKSHTLTPTPEHPTLRGKGMETYKGGQGYGRVCQGYKGLAQNQHI